MKTKHPRLENWAVKTAANPYLPPELKWDVLTGLVFGHPRHLDGKDVATSHIVGQRAGRVVTASGTEYELGVVESGYERVYPNAKVRLFAALPVMPKAKRRARQNGIKVGGAS